MKTTAEKIAVMQAYEEGKKIRIEFDFGTMVTFCIKSTHGELEWDWKKCKYEIVEEPKQVLFDFSDAISLISRVFKHKNSGYIGMCVWVDDAILYLGVVPIDYKELADNWLIWTGTLNEWLPCTKTVNN